MTIETDIRELLINPLLRHDLAVIVDDFQFDLAGVPNPFRATIFCLPTDETLRLELRFPGGCNLSSIFPQRETITVNDFRSATGSVNGKVLIRITEIQPPHNVESGYAGDLFRCVATLDFGKIEILRDSLVRQDVDQDSVPEPDSTEVQNEKFSPLEEFEGYMDEIDEDFTHVVIIADTKVPFRNTSIVHAEEHPFWERNSKPSLISWDGEAFGGAFSMMQEGNHLRIGFRHRAANREEAARKAEALFAGMGYTLGVNAWPSYSQIRQCGCVLSEFLRFVRPVQGKYVPLRKKHGLGAKSAPTILIASVARWLSEVGDEERNSVDHLLWVFRGADNRNVPTPAKLAMIGAVIESLFASCDKISPPAAFTDLSQDAKAWAKGEIEAAGADSERGGFAKRLVGHLGNLAYCDRRVKWKSVFQPLFPDREDWLNEIYNLYQSHRNPAAHGNFAATMAGDGVDLIHAIGRLSGFVNLVIAAKAGYKGPILESTSADRVFNLR